MLRRLLDFFFPRICPICEGRLSYGEEEVCVSCLLTLPRTNHWKSPEYNSMTNLFELQIPVVRAAALMRYIPETDSARLIKRIKYYKGIDTARYMGRMLVEEFRDTGRRQKFFEGIDLIIPMPITRGRRRKRGYCQAEEIARGIRQMTGLPIDSKAVERRFFKVSQTKLDYLERQENVRDAFRCLHPERLSGRHILIVEDVVTTGATVRSLAQTIMKETTGVTFTVLSIAITGELKV